MLLTLKFSVLFVERLLFARHNPDFLLCTNSNVGSHYFLHFIGESKHIIFQGFILKTFIDLFIQWS